AIIDSAGGELGSTGQVDGKVACRGCQAASLNTWQNDNWQQLRNGCLNRQPVEPLTPARWRDENSRPGPPGGSTEAGQESIELDPAAACRPASAGSRSNDRIRT